MCEAIQMETAHRPRQHRTALEESRKSPLLTIRHPFPGFLSDEPVNGLQSYLPVLSLEENIALRNRHDHAKRRRGKAVSFEEFFRQARRSINDSLRPAEVRLPEVAILSLRRVVEIDHPLETLHPCRTVGEVLLEEEQHPVCVGRVEARLLAAGASHPVDVEFNLRAVRKRNFAEGHHTILVQ
ncbi:MAG: hypothetical protein JW395_1150 [Nitrospira sp.]|nr:hypothetical protein [Nitrospira sp.]